MIISPASRGRATGSRVRSPVLLPAAPLFKLDGGLPCAAVAGVAGPLAAVGEAPPAALVADDARPIIVSPVASAERSILARFLDDLALAPELAGELVALYAEQHPELTLRFVQAALHEAAQAGRLIRAAAARREACGLGGLALVLRAALALVAPADALDGPAVIVDIAPLALDDDFPWGERDPCGP